MARTNFVQAFHLLEEGLAIFQKTGFSYGIRLYLKDLAILAIERGDMLKAVRLFGAVERVQESAKIPLNPVERVEYELAQAKAQLELGLEKYSALLDEGRAMSMEEAIKFALEEDDGT